MKYSLGISDFLEEISGLSHSSVFLCFLALIISIQFSSVQSPSRVRLFATPWSAACQASLSITNSRSLLKLIPMESVMPSSHLILCHPLLLLPPVLPSIRVFSGRLYYLFLLFFGTMHSDGYIFPFLLCLLFFSQLFVRPPQTTILPFCISFSWEWSWPPPSVQCYKPPSIVLQAPHQI